MAVSGDAHDGEPQQNLDSPEAVAKRLQWWTDARFGMFIHWGLYSQWGCHYPGPDGKMLDGHSAHMMRYLQIPLTNYAKIADVFDPTNFNAAEWARVAKEAGMKYMIITSKHHDGFAMFDSQCNDYNVVARMPWHRDPLKALAAACRKQGIKFGVYYSLGRDWADPDVPTKKGFRSNTWDYPDESKKVFARYFERKAKPQIRELLTQYHPAVMWFDTPEEISKAESEELVRMIHKLQPDCIINSRIGHRLGDYGVQEQNIPGSGETQPWETCMTINHHWAYYKGDDNYKSTETLIRHLVDIASKGGNFLLDVGPTGSGVIPKPEVSRLRQMGDWLKVNGASIYGTSASPLEEQPAWGRVTKKGDTLYLHVFDWPNNGKLILKDFPFKVRHASLLANAKTLSFSSSTSKATVNGKTTASGETSISLPDTPIDPVDTVVVLEL